MNELAIQSANGTNAELDREMIQTEIDQLVSEIDRIASTTEFNSQQEVTVIVHFVPLRLGLLRLLAIVFDIYDLSIRARSRSR